MSKSIAYQVSQTPNDTQGATDHSQYDAVMTDADGSFSYVDSSGTTVTVSNLISGVWHYFTGIAWVRATSTAATAVYFGNKV